MIIEKELNPMIGPVPDVAEQASLLRQTSKELRADSQRLKVKSIEINRFADALAVRVAELTFVLDRMSVEC